MGQEQFTNDLEAWVTEKIKRDNVIILSAMTALSAVGGGKSNLSRANNLAYSVDKEYKRTLSIITKADEASYKVPEVLKVAVSKSSNHGSRTGCVLVGDAWQMCNVSVAASDSTADFRVVSVRCLMSRVSYSSSSAR
jgi:hypothetical protein